MNREIVVKMAIVLNDEWTNQKDFMVSLALSQLVQPMCDAVHVTVKEPMELEKEFVHG